MRRRSATTVLALLLLAACGDTTSFAPSATGDLPNARIGNPTAVVSAGGSIQAAVEAADPGAIIHIEPGLYREGITVTRPDITLVGLNDKDGAGVAIQNPGGVRNGIEVRAGAHRFALHTVTVRGFDANGVFLVGVDGFLLSRVVAENNGAYGLFPVRSTNGVIEHSVASGHADAGLYIGQSSSVTMRQNKVYGNVVGIEASNSSDVKLLANEAWDNTNGILAVLLPGRQIKVANGMLIAGNKVWNNNRPNFARPGDLVGAVPAGTGILIVGADQVVAEDNTVTGHEFLGIGVGSSLVLAALSGAPPESFADIEPDPDGTRVRSNAVTGNGTSTPIPFLPPADLLWDGSGTENCWLGNTFGSSFPTDLPACP